MLDNLQTTMTSILQRRDIQDLMITTNPCVILNKERVNGGKLNLSLRNMSLESKF